MRVPKNVPRAFTNVRKTPPDHYPLITSFWDFIAFISKIMLFSRMLHEVVTVMLINISKRLVQFNPHPWFDHLATCKYTSCPFDIDQHPSNGKFNEIKTSLKILHFFYLFFKIKKTTVKKPVLSEIQLFRV